MADPKKTPAVPTSVTLRFKVRARSGRAIDGATVTVTAGSTTKTETSDAQGFAKITLMKADVDASSGAINVTVKKFHHGPDPFPSPIVSAGPLTVSMTVSLSGFDPTVANVVKDASGLFLDCVLADGGMRLATPQNRFAQADIASGIRARRLTNDQVQQELMWCHLEGSVTLTPGSDFIFDHDTSMGEFDPCDPAKCKVKNPPIANRVSLKKPTVGPVTFFALTNFGVSAIQKTDLPGQHFLRDTFDWANTSLQTLDQRHVIGLVRLCNELNLTHGVVAIYTQGVNGDTSRSDCHGYGMALDFGGMSTNLPDPAAKHMTVRLGVDFIVDLHWGQVPMWDGTTVAANPSDPTTWRRQAGDDGFDYSKDPSGARNKLHYRLDPAPFQDPAPAGTDAAVAAQMATVATHFQAAGGIFKAVFDFATTQYTDADKTLGPLSPPAPEPTPTTIDDQSGHFILHPDYGTPNTPNVLNAKDGRQAHINHLHFQLGQTFYNSPRTT
jgi:hypothetical protein